MQESRQAHSPGRRLSAPERREAILDAALQVFGARGYETASMSEVAAAGGISKPVLYDHFASKRDLYVALVDRESASLSAALTASLDPAASLDERLRTLASTAIDHARRNPESSRLLSSTPAGDAAVRDAHARFRADAQATTADAILADPVFEAAPGLSRRASAELIGDLQVAVLERLVRWALEHPRNSASALSEVFVDVLWKGLSS
jgi:AcrR family transcriptional regulator